MMGLTGYVQPFALTLLLLPGLASAFATPAEVQFPSLDGTVLKAWVFHPANLAQAKDNDAPSGPQPGASTSTAAITPVFRGTVVALHGCGGLYATAGSRKGLFNARHQAMADRLVEAGYTAVFPDSLTPRGVSEICTQKMNQRSITQRERRRDALATVNWVSQQPWAKADKVAVLGWSHGGSAVLAATDASQPEVQAQPTPFATAIAFYPGCSASLKSGYKPNTTLTLLLGEKDDWTPAQPCIALGQAVGAQVTVFPDSYHDFDNPQGAVRLRSDVPNGVNPGQGVHAGPNPVAREAANALVMTRLKAALQ